MELHTFQADQQNQRREGWRFYKLDQESVTTLQEDLANDHHALAQAHSQEIQGLLDEYGDAQLQMEVGQEAYEPKASRRSIGREGQGTEHITLDTTKPPRKRPNADPQGIR